MSFGGEAAGAIADHDYYRAAQLYAKIASERESVGAKDAADAARGLANSLARAYREEGAEKYRNSRPGGGSL